MGFKPFISEGGRPQSCVLDRPATGTASTAEVNGNTVDRVALYQGAVYWGDSFFLKILTMNISCFSNNRLVSVAGMQCLCGVVNVDLVLRPFALTPTVNQHHFLIYTLSFSV